MKRKKDNHQKRIHPQSNPQSIYRTSGENRSKHERVTKKDFKAKKIDADLIEETDHPE